MFCRADESFLWHPLGTENLQLEINKSQFSSLIFFIVADGGGVGGGGELSVVNPRSMNSYSTTFFPSHANFRDLHT